MSVKIKVCGVSSAEQARQISALGADYIGVIFAANSPRRVPLETAAHIAAARGKSKLVGVFAEPDADFIIKTVNLLNLDVAQLHFANHNAIAARLSGVVETWGAFSLSSPADVEAARASACAMPLVDSRAQNSFGGTGLCADWLLAKQLAAARPIVLAGGISLQNAAEAARLVRPRVLDVNSRFETRPGVKDLSLLEKLFKLKL